MIEYDRCSVQKKRETTKYCRTKKVIDYKTVYEQCPVYKDWCSWDYYTWPIIDSAATSGNDHAPYWPKLEANGQLQRLDRAESYRVSFNDINDHKAASYNYSPGSNAEYGKFSVGHQWKLSVTNIGFVTPIEVEKSSK